MKRERFLPRLLGQSQNMHSELIDLLKQDVAKWEEAAKAMDTLLSHMPETDRTQWSGRVAQYKHNAKAMRELVAQIAENVT